MVDIDYEMKVYGLIILAPFFIDFTRYNVLPLCIFVLYDINEITSFFLILSGKLLPIQINIPGLHK